MSNEPDKAPPQKESPLTFWQIVGSVIAAAFGVQSRANKVRDFSRGRPIHFIVAGILFTTGFVLIVVLVVKFALRNVS